MDLDKTIEAIVLELIHTYQITSKPPVKVLYVLEDSYLADSFTDQWIDLHNHGITYDILTLDGETSGWLGEHYIECTRSGGKCIAIDESAPAPLELPKAYDAIVIPELDLDTASRIIHGLKGKVKAELIYAAILQNKTILVAQDSSGIKRSDRRTLQTLALPPVYNRQYQRTLANLQELGIELCSSGFFAKKLIAHYKSEPEQTSEGVSESKVSIRKLLTTDKVREWLLATTKSELTVAKGTIITALAADLMKEKGIALHVIE